MERGVKDCYSGVDEHMVEIVSGLFASSNFFAEIAAKPLDSTGRGQHLSYIYGGMANRAQRPC
jgi:major membrane immunogen (membrane-anchored lipoprotein)